MSTQLKKLHRKIMRRVYYAYAIRLVTLPGVPQGFLSLASMIALTYFVSLGNVLANLMQAPVSHMGVSLYNAITNTEAWTLLLIGISIFSLLSYRLRIPTLNLFERAKI